jgi:hypothetical protein
MLVVASKVPVVKPVVRLAVPVVNPVLNTAFATFNEAEEILLALRVPVVIPRDKFSVAADAFVNTAFVMVALLADSGPVEILVVARRVPVVIPDDALRVPFTSNV